LRIATGIDVSLDPSVDVSITGGASEDRFTTDNANDSLNVNGSNVIEDERGLEGSGGSGALIEDRGIRHDDVDHCDRTNAINSDVEPNLHVVDIDSLESPLPVPEHSDSSVRTVDGEVSDGKLLISDIETDITTVDDKVSHKATTGNSDSELDS
jgi:hypothetical protein